MADQFQLPNGMFSISPDLTAWVDSQRRAGRSDSDIMSQMRRVIGVLQPLKDAEAPIAADVSRTETEMNLGWAESNPELFVQAVKAFQAKTPAAQWTHRIDLSRVGFVTLTAIRRDSVIEFPATVQVEIDWDRVANAVVGVVESSYSPWIGRMDHDYTDPTSCRLREELRDAGKIWYSEGVYYDQNGRLDFRYDGPDDGEGTFQTHKAIGQEDFKRGFAKMAADSPAHFADMIAENDDAITHDVFMQYVILGEVVYG